jgi:spore coat polysaccharide biosynthesis predicted glycosyltransferase SpsG
LKSNSLIEILCEGNNIIGYGHIRRSLTLFNYLKKSGLNIKITGLSKTAQQMLPKQNADEREPKILIFDSPLNIDNHLKKKNTQFTIALDYFGKSSTDINIVIYPHEIVRAKIAKYIGLQYVIIRDEVSILAPAKPAQKNEKVLIVLGGADLLNQGHKVAKYLTNLGLVVTLVQGPFVKSKSVDLLCNYDILRNPENLANLYLESDWVVTNGGGCLFEVLSLGKAAYVLPQTDKEFAIASFFQKKKLILGIGIDNLRKFTLKEINNTEILNKNLIDKKGLQRILAIVQSIL